MDKSVITEINYLKRQLQFQTQQHSALKKLKTIELLRGRVLYKMQNRFRTLLDQVKDFTLN